MRQQPGPDAPLHCHFHQPLTGNLPETSRARPRSALGSPPRCTCQKHLLMEGLSGLPHLAPLRSRGSALSSSEVSELQT